MWRMPLDRRILVRMWRIGYIVAMPMSAPPAFTAYAVCSVVLSLEMLFLGGYTAATRARHKGYMNPEDDKVSFKDARLVEGAEHPDVARVQRAHRGRRPSRRAVEAIHQQWRPSPQQEQRQSHQQCW